MMRAFRPNGSPGLPKAHGSRLFRPLLAAISLWGSGCQTVAPPKSNATDFRNVRGQQIFVQEKGVGQPGDSKTIAILSGFPDHSQNQTALINGFAANHRVLAYDRLGMGLSAKPAAEYRMELWLDELDSILQEQSPGKNVLLGHSFGGTLAVYYAAQHPEKVKAIVLINPVLIMESGHGGLFGPKAALLAAPVIGDLMAAFHSRTITRRGLEGLFYDRTRITPGMIDAYHFPFQMPGGMSAYMESLRGIRRLTTAITAEQMEKLRQSGIPVLLFWSQNDPSLPLSDAPGIAAKLGAQLHEIPLCGHLPQLELSAMRLQKEIIAPTERFLEKLP